MFMRYDYLDETRLLGTGNVGWYIVRVRNPRTDARVASGH